MTSQNQINNSSMGGGSATSTCSNPDFYVDGLPACVEQGPVWLAKIAYQKPSWVTTVATFLVVVVVGLAWLGYRRHGLDEDVLEEMGFMGVVAIGTLAWTNAIAKTLTVPYLADVLIGAIGGVVTANLVVRGAGAVFDDRDTADG